MPLSTPEVANREGSFKLSWQGDTADLEIYRAADDEKILEIVFDAFNGFQRPKNYDHDLRSLSIGDVVILDHRPYQCGPIGWTRLAEFDGES